MRGGNARAGEQLAQVFDIFAIQHIAVVRMMQKALYAIQGDAKARAMRRLNLGAQVIEQRFNLAPVDVAADRVMKDSVQ